MIWEQQWELFAPDFRDGKAHIDLSPFGCKTVLQLLPGPGFGDLSHPTTRLMLKLMQPHVKGKTVIDIGCGSGILSVAAEAMGAKKVYGYDIDPDAVAHSRKNSKTVTFSEKPPEEIEPDTIFLMNMISSEQEQAWKLIRPRVRGGILITSGILEKDKENYLNNRPFMKMAQEEAWVGFVFKIHPSPSHHPPLREPRV
jgi:ribosomal protein L11 methyltransferase